MFFQNLYWIERTLKISLKKHPSPQNHTLVVLCKEYRSPNQYQVNGKYQVHFIKIPENSCFVHLHIILHNISSLGYSLSRSVFCAKNYAALLTESFRLSLSYWFLCSLQIAIHPLPLSSSSPLHCSSSSLVFV